MSGQLNEVTIDRLREIRKDALETPRPVLLDARAELVAWSIRSANECRHTAATMRRAENRAAQVAAESQDARARCHDAAAAMLEADGALREIAAEIERFLAAKLERGDVEIEITRYGGRAWAAVRRTDS